MRVVVVGGGPAGIAAAVHARRLGAQVMLLERSRLGGVCYNEGPVPVRTLARAARMAREARDWADFGLIGNRPRVDIRAALARAERAVSFIYELQHTSDHLRAEGIEVEEGIGPVHFVDAQTLAVAGGRTVTADRIILAVGGHDRRLSIPGAEVALSFRDVLHLETLPERIVVIGGASTGCQLASIFGDFGARVTLLETAPRLIAQEDQDLGEALGHAFTGRGIDVRTGALTQRLERTPTGIRVHVSRGQQDEQVEGDAVFLAIGWPGNVEELSLAAVGIEAERGYIKVDECLRTSQPHIFAVGDVNGIRKLVQTAVQQGRLAAENAVLGRDQRYESSITPSGSFTDPEYASVGMTEAAARVAHDCVVARHDYTLLTRAVVDQRTDGFCKLIAERGSGMVVGAHVLGAYSAEIIQVAAVCMAARMNVLQIAELQLAYPTFTQAIGHSALRLARELDLLPKLDRSMAMT
ncbi:MAG TPA: NAD(P)/FAD-dependent oxidoreductase [Nitrospiraceae bacterium]|nr:NAD(P)/FAD-dependent oxidoreductase [Nitrospiraceae bacterium]